jgi:hypothetical protein
MNKLTELKIKLKTNIKKPTPSQIKPDQINEREENEGKNNKQT